MTKLFLEKPLDAAEVYTLAEQTDLLYRKLRNRGYARRHADAILPDDHTAIQLAAIRIIKNTKPGVRPAQHVNSLNLAVLRVVTMSAKRAVCLGTEGRVYGAKRGHLFFDGRFIPTAEKLTANYVLFSSKDSVELKRIAVLRPTDEHLS